MFALAGAVLTAGCVIGRPLELAQSRAHLTFLKDAHWKTGLVEGRECLILDVPGQQRPPVRRRVGAIFE